MKKVIETAYRVKLNGDYSYKIYVTNNLEDAEAVKAMCDTMQDMRGKRWYYNVSVIEVENDYRVPDMFKRRGYWAAIVEHNNGDWNKRKTYSLYIVE